MNDNTKCCSACGRYYTTGGNSHFKLCRFCNHKRLNEGKLKTPIRRKYKPTGELMLFKKIYESRPHFCEWCNKPINGFSIMNYHHIKPKSTHPELRLDENNIVKICDKCHIKTHS